MFYTDISSQVLGIQHYDAVTNSVNQHLLDCRVTSYIHNSERQDGDGLATDGSRDLDVGFSVFISFFRLPPKFFFYFPASASISMSKFQRH